MSRTRRTGPARFGKTAQRVVPLLVGIAVAVTSAILLSGDPASASATSVTVSFTANGPSPASVTINPGDQVVFVNKIDPNAGNLLGVVTGLLGSVDVEVTGATQPPGFTLKPGASRAFTYTQPVKATYTATYQPKAVLGILPAGEMTTTGSLLVRSPSGEAAPVVTPAATPTTSSAGTGQGGQGGQAGQAGQGAPPPAGTQSDGTASTGQHAQDGQHAGTGPQVNFTPRSGNAAAGQVPTGGADMPPPVPIDPKHDPVSRTGTVLPQLGSAEANPSLHRASHDTSTGSLGLPAIAAVVLLSLVSAGLVRTIMVRQATLA